MLAKSFGRNLLNNFFDINNISKNIKIISSSNFNILNSIHTSNKIFNASRNDENVNDTEFQKDVSSGLRNLEKLGIIKPYMSWPQYNRIIYPPTEDGKLLKNPFVHHMRTFIKYPAKKLWYPAFMIRGMSIDEAIKQLSFHKLKGAAIIKETLLEAQELAIKEHNIEYKSNLWISFSSASTAGMVKGIRKHMATRYGIVKYRYSHYFVRLEEGKPPNDYAATAETYENRAKEYIEKLRSRSVHLSI